MAFIGAITALLGACVAVAQNDIKRVLAFSTVSQLGYMMITIRVGSWVAAISHLLTHAFFKALLFLGAGSVIHASHHEQDMRKLGGLGGGMQRHVRDFRDRHDGAGWRPLPFSGYWSKEAILHAAYEWDVSSLPLIMALAAVVLTAFYMTRLVAEVFLGKPRSESAGHAHESPSVMTVPLLLLAACAVVIGFLGTPAWPWLQSVLTGAPVEPHSLLEGASLILLSILLVCTGIGAGWALYARRLRETAEAPDPVEAAFPRIFALAAARMKFDELYAATFGRLNSALASLSSWMDRRVWGGAIDSLARFGEAAGRFNKETDDEGLNTGFNAASEELRGVGKLYSRAQYRRGARILEDPGHRIRCPRNPGYHGRGPMSTSLPLLSLIVFLPWLGAFLLLLLPRLGAWSLRVLSLAFSLSTLLLAGLVLARFDPSAGGFQLPESHDWIASLNVHFRLGLDGLSLVLVLLTAVLGPLSMLASWRQVNNPRLLNILFLLLQGAALGVFLALDFVPWFLFWELSLVPPISLSGSGAGRAQRVPRTSS